MLDNTKKENIKVYRVNKIRKDALFIDGYGGSPKWLEANVLNNFVSPWTNDKISNIEFRALWDTQNFYFNFKVIDSTVHVNPDNYEYRGVNNSDRVELFFRKDKTLDPYYCLEIDPSPRLMDFKAKPNKNFDFNWSWSKEDILIKSSKNQKGFIVEGAITTKSLLQYGLLDNGRMEVGVYRAKYVKKESEDFEPTWITWVDPQTTEPNFHIASSFGTFLFV